MEKITVQHFVNKDLIPRIENGKRKYPLYVQVIALRKNLRFKSNNNYFVYLSESELDNEFAKSMLQHEIDTIEYIVRDLIDIDKKELITSKNLGMYSQNLNDIIQDKFCKLLLREHEETGEFVPNILLSSSYDDINEIIFFYNDDKPIISISEKTRYCLKAIEAIYDETQKGQFYVYDLFYGKKQEVIKHEINHYTGFDEKETERMILSLQDLTQL